MDVLSGEKIVRLILPLDQYRVIRDDMVDIYIAAYHQYPPAKQAFSELSVSDLQDRAGKNAVAALSYDPNAALSEIQRKIKTILRWIAVVLVSIFLFGVGTGVSSLTTFSREGIQFLTTVGGILLTIVAGGSTTVGVVAGLVFLYVWWLSASSTVITVLNEELIYGPSHFKTRDHDCLVGYTIWNSSLDGGGAIKLLLIFSSLRVLSALPKFNPYCSIRNRVCNNIDLFVEADGFIHGFKMAFNRVRKNKGNNEKGAER